MGWDGSPLVRPAEDGLCRSIPFPTRRATLKEATRVFNELSTVILSPTSLVTDEKVATDVKVTPRSTAPSAASSSSARQIKGVSGAQPAKGTAHLKKRVGKEKHQTRGEDDAGANDDASPPAKEELKDEYVALLETIYSNNVAELQSKAANSPELLMAEFSNAYFEDHPEVYARSETMGVVGVAAALDAMESLEWLLQNGAPLNVGRPVYLVTKSKKVRTFLRRFWYQHPDLHDYAAAEIPGPLSDADMEAQSAKDREKRKRDRERKKEKQREAEEAAKPPELRARELRASAAEARLLPNRCAWCKKSLDEITPFQRLLYKYCSMKCLHEHRNALANMR